MSGSVVQGSGRWRINHSLHTFFFLLSFLSPRDRREQMQKLGWKANFFLFRSLCGLNDTDSQHSFISNVEKSAGADDANANGKGNKTRNRNRNETFVQPVLVQHIRGRIILQKIKRCIRANGGFQRRKWLCQNGSKQRFVEKQNHQTERFGESPWLRKNATEMMEKENKREPTACVRMGK